eukprot:TRINITY_DN47296_c0_g1_i1.p1 TRINITY_DN47296_c0_g1~~TRINITY_DN47296_c0_g1_i1.p1  ORF type:complete len:225 (+),score=59.21 TRINITY_DN47296_c0_g1_i1:57-677(+)
MPVADDADLPDVPNKYFGRPGRSQPDLWSRLGVQRGAGRTEVVKAFRRLAAVLHPDKNPGNDEAKKRFQLVSEAYEILTNEQLKEQYLLRIPPAPAVAAVPAVARPRSTPYAPTSRGRGESRPDPFLGSVAHKFDRRTKSWVPDGKPPQQSGGFGGADTEGPVPWGGTGGAQPAAPAAAYREFPPAPLRYEGIRRPPRSRSMYGDF